MEALEPRHGFVASVTEPIDTREPHGQFVAELLVAQARMESANTRLRHRRKAMEQRENGLPPSSGMRCFGYAKGYAAVVPEEAVLVREAVDSLFAGRSLGRFALTGLLLDRLLATPQSRIVTVSSVAHRSGHIRFDDINFERNYRASAAYAQSKLANLMFTYLLQSKLEASLANTISVAAHPGWARTDLQRHVAARWWWKAVRWVEPVFSQSADAGALPTLRAATDPTTRGGEYYGPSGFMQRKGSPVRVLSSARSLAREAQERLWDVSEKLTGRLTSGGGVQVTPICGSGSRSSPGMQGSPSSRGRVQQR